MGQTRCWRLCLCQEQSTVVTQPVRWPCWLPQLAADIIIQLQGITTLSDVYLNQSKSSSDAPRQGCKKRCCCKSMSLWGFVYLTTILRRGHVVRHVVPRGSPSFFANFKSKVDLNIFIYICLVLIFHKQNSTEITPGPVFSTVRRRLAVIGSLFTCPAF